MQPSARSTSETIERAEDGHSVDDLRERDRLSEEVSGRHEEGEHRQPGAIRDGRERDAGSEPHEVGPPVAEHGALPEVEGECWSERDEEAGEVGLVGPGAEEPDETDGNHHLQGPPRAHVERIAEVRHPGDEDCSDDGRPEGHRDRRRGRDRCRGRADHDEFRDSGRRLTGDEGPKVVPDAACRLRREVVHDADHEDSQEGAGRENSFGVNIMLPFEQGPNTTIADDPKLVTFKSDGGHAYAVHRSHALLEDYLTYRDAHFRILLRQIIGSFALQALASASLQAEWYRDGWFLYATAGVAVMFVLNLGVSFFLSLHTALRAYDFPRRDLVELAGRLLREFVRDPLGFILPPREPEAPVSGSTITEKAVGE